MDHHRAIPEQPNIVVVMADDMRADDLRFMPHVRRLVAGTGLSFRNSFSPYPLCCPARASFLTGQYPHNHRILSNEEPWGFGAFDDRATIATSLQAAGYRTGFVGKYLNNYGAVPSAVTGEPSWHYVPAGWSDWRGLVQLPPDSRIKNGGTYDYFHPIFNVDGRTDDTHRGEYQTGVVGRFARELLARYAAKQDPFFLYLSALAPHTGFPEEPDDLGRANAWIPTPARPDWVKGRYDEIVTRSPGIPAVGQPEADVSDKPGAVRALPLDAADVAEDLTRTRQRAESLYVLDLEIGRLIETLRETGTLDRTVLMFTSDNGYFLGEHRRVCCKTLPYEPALRVPFLVTGPGVPHGVRFDPVKTPDLAATILDLADADAPHLADGRLARRRHGGRRPRLVGPGADRGAGGWRLRRQRKAGTARVPGRPHHDRPADGEVQAGAVGHRRGGAVRPRRRPERADQRRGAAPLPPGRARPDGGVVALQGLRRRGVCAAATRAVRRAARSAGATDRRPGPRRPRPVRGQLALVAGSRLTTADLPTSGRAPRTATNTATAQIAVPTTAQGPGRSPNAAAAHTIVAGGVR